MQGFADTLVFACIMLNACTWYVIQFFIFCFVNLRLVKPTLSPMGNNHASSIAIATYIAKYFTCAFRQSLFHYTSPQKFIAMWLCMANENLPVYCFLLSGGHKDIYSIIKILGRYTYYVIIACIPSLTITVMLARAVFSIFPALFLASQLYNVTCGVLTGTSYRVEIC